MIKKKVCMLGAFAVGKTSLVQKFVHSIFSEKYHTTVGVKIDKKSVTIKNKKIELILWDLHGKDEFQDIRTSYLKGASGCIYVADGTRKSTLDTFIEIKSDVDKVVGAVPSVLALNKIDLESDWEIDPDGLGGVEKDVDILLTTSAKTGIHVENAFQSLAELMTKD